MRRHICLYSILCRIVCRHIMKLKTRFSARTKLFFIGFFILLFFTALYTIFVPKIKHNEDVTLLNKNLDRVLQIYEILLPTANTLQPIDAQWQNVSQTEWPKLFVFSAHYDRRPGVPRSVRLIGAVKMDAVPIVWCRLWYNTQPPQSLSVFASIEIIHENWNRPYTACFIVCPLDDHTLIPHSVSVVHTLRSVPMNRLLVVDNYQQLLAGGDEAPGKLALCAQPIHSFHETVHIIEFIELYSILGVAHFTFYNNNTDPDVSCVLQEYVSQGRVTLLPWELSLPRDQDIWVQGIHAALNDCLLRNLYRYSNLVMVDLDEFIVPSYHGTLVDLIEFLDETQISKTPVGSYIFQNAFFFRDHENDPSVLSTNKLETQLLTISKTRRNVFLNPHPLRSKYICKPEWTLETGNHFVWRFVSRRVYSVNVESRFGKSHHYRSCWDWVNCTVGESMIDQTAYRYRDKLSRNVLAAVNSFKDKCRVEGLI